MRNTSSLPYPPGAEQSAHRLDALDGLRALAILWVAYYHYFYFWSPAGEGMPILAYGDAHAWLPFASIGFLGVSLFFIISGFVILLTLERTGSLKEFFTRRVIRLWPSLILFGTLTFAFVHAFGPKEMQVGWWEYLISLFAVPPAHVGKVVGATDWNWLDGAYWSLWVEVKFYCVIGLLFFIFAEGVIGAWILFELATIVIGLLSFFAGGTPLHMLDGFLFEPYVPYFSFGLAGYLMWSGRDGLMVRLLVAVAIAHVAVISAMHLAQYPHATTWYATQYLFAQVAIFVTFYLFATRRWTLSMLAWEPLARVGRASYGIYLLHQNVGVIILSAAFFAGAFPSLIGPALIFALFAAIATLIYERVETPVQAWLKQRLIPKRSRQRTVAATTDPLRRAPGQSTVI